MVAVQAYVDLRHFGHLPRAGGTFDQPGDLMEELRYVADTVARADRAKAERERRSANRRGRGKGR